jgi:hypothetical protein
MAGMVTAESIILDPLTAGKQFSSLLIKLHNPKRSLVIEKLVIGIYLVIVI